MELSILRQEEREKISGISAKIRMAIERISIPKDVAERLRVQKTHKAW